MMPHTALVLQAQMRNWEVHVGHFRAKCWKVGPCPDNLESPTRDLKSGLLRGTRNVQC